MNKHKVLNENQFGFRKRHSCEDAILLLTETIRKALDENMKTISCYIDLEKAFDTVDHKILLQKCYNYGLRGSIYQILAEFLSNRQQFVEHDNKRSVLEKISFGVPQGSVLGPLLFLIYINDLPDQCKTTKSVLFADDTSILAKGDNRECINNLAEDTKYIDKWFKANKLCVNSEKCKLTSFGRSNFQPPLSVFDSIIQYCNEYKYLGLWVDSSLNYKTHIESVCAKLSRSNGLMYRTRHCFSRKTLLMFYEAYAKPVILYGLLIYGSSNKSYLKKIFMKQKQIIRTIFHYRKFDTTSKIFLENNIESVYELYFSLLI